MATDWTRMDGVVSLSAVPGQVKEPAVASGKVVTTSGGSPMVFCKERAGDVQGEACSRSYGSQGEAAHPQNGGGTTHGASPEVAGLAGVPGSAGGTAPWPAVAMGVAHSPDRGTLPVTTGIGPVESVMAVRSSGKSP